MGSGLQAVATQQERQQTVVHGMEGGRLTKTGHLLRMEPVPGAAAFVWMGVGPILRAILGFRHGRVRGGSRFRGDEWLPNRSTGVGEASTVRG